MPAIHCKVSFARPLVYWRKPLYPVQRVPDLSAGGDRFLDAQGEPRMIRSMVRAPVEEALNIRLGE